MNNGNTVTGEVFNIQRFSVQDGAGVRTLVFLKGCPLRCLWCCNPESQQVRPTLLYDKRRCVHCQRCVQVCSKSAVKQGKGIQIIDREICDCCGECASNCFAGALEMSGKTYTVEEVFEEVSKDRLLYENSGGGVTLSGGEPFMQAEFAGAVFERCHRAGIRTAVETCGCVPWESIEGALPYVDMFLFDIKQMDPEIHKKFTGVTNDLVLSNLQRLSRTSKSIVVRLPIIPGVNDNMEHIRGVISFMQENGLAVANLLPFHKFGLNKYESIGREYAFRDEPSIPDDLLEEMKEEMTRAGIETTMYKH